MKIIQARTDHVSIEKFQALPESCMAQTSLTDFQATVQDFSPAASWPVFSRACSIPSVCIAR
jgi:hypothetical protein